MKITDLAKAISPDAEINYIGIRPGEKLHEVLLSEDEARESMETDDMYLIRSRHCSAPDGAWPGAKPLLNGFRYTSDSNSRWLTPGELLSLIKT
jgi:UDP-N-acetylglucosamine 4,6-dehydratase